MIGPSNAGEPTARPPRRDPVLVASRVLFGLYAAALAMATHWPQLRLPESPVTSSDKALHVGAFFVWAVLLALAGVFGPRFSGRNLLLSLLLALAYGVIDEATQAIPGVNRFVSVGDALANAVGCVAGIAAVWGASRLVSARPEGR